ncbi:XdhC/CoxI family protein [Alteromonadaceae bacterium M269]|nr:XdhC/CoxI family protein [Alteromonadaceae bacterium M269]
MSNHINQLVNHWFTHKDECQWVLATVISTEGSSYRKPGAMMLINDLGQYFGLVSGGCLESDIIRKARRCLVEQINSVVKYDMREEQDLAWQLGIGCGGMVEILLQPILEQNSWLGLETVHMHMNSRTACSYKISLSGDIPDNQVLALANIEQYKKNPHHRVYSRTTDAIELILVPSPHIAIFGGGVDARPLVNLAIEMGWEVTLIDHRAGYARESEFPRASRIVNIRFEQINEMNWFRTIDAAVVMGHNVTFDAEALKLLQGSCAHYIGLLGPVHRTEKVLAEAKLARTNLPKQFANPIGLNIGGDLPESIALSILSEIHAYMHQSDAQSHANILMRHNEDKGRNH